jgi:NitT/TauT family transport system substrate-binding protein/putative hydroxymethylpyrimidine transport system substrate-binding protein
MPAPLTAALRATRRAARRALRRRVAIGPALGVGLLALALAGCGGDEEDEAPGGGGGRLGEPTQATLVLDFLPNAVHAGIYRALADGCYAERNLELEIVEPTSTADTLKLIDAGRADFGIADGIDVAGQIEAGRGAKGIMAVVQRPLGGVIALRESGIRDPGELEGRTVGVTGVPSDGAVLEALVDAAGADPSAVETVTIGFNGVQALENRQVDGFTGYVAADGTQVAQDGFPTVSFPLDEHGGPRYPGLVMFTTEERIAEAPELIGAMVACTVEGYERTIEDPRGSLRDLLAEVPGLDEELAAAQLDAYLPLLEAGARYGTFDSDDLESLSRFLVESDLAAAPIDPDRYATNEFVPEAG